MATRAQKTKVGIFLVVSTVVIVVGFAIISGYQTEPQTRYSMEFDESILGLSVGGLVVYRGVPVGKVDNITVTDNYLAHVDVLISQTKLRSLREGVTAQLVLYSLATGSMCVSLEGGEPDAPLLAPGTMIPTKNSLVKEFSSQIAELLDNFKEILGDVRNGMKGIGEGDLAKVVTHTDELIQSGRDMLDSANDTVLSVRDDVREGLADFRGLAKDLRTLSQDTTDLINTIKGKVEPLKLSQTEEGVQAMLKNVNELSEKLKSSVELLDTVSKSIVHDTDNVEYSLRDSLNEMGETLRALHDLLIYVKEDPSALIRGKGQPK